jgi:multimeric flavodoxin WrbA
VYYGNPSSDVLKFVEDKIGPYWESRNLAGRSGGVFSTGGGISQGTESVMISLTRSLLAFGYRMITPDVTNSGFDGAFGISAVTGTPPCFPGTNGTIASEFMEAAERYGKKFIQ